MAFVTPLENIVGRIVTVATLLIVLVVLAIGVFRRRAV
jgi:hypothetical protein